MLLLLFAKQAVVTTSTVTYTTPGSTNIVVPQGAFKAVIECWGGGGGGAGTSGYGGYGGTYAASTIQNGIFNPGSGLTISFLPGDIFTMVVGAGGNRGGTGGTVSAGGQSYIDSNQGIYTYAAGGNINNGGPLTSNGDIIFNGGAGGNDGGGGGGSGYTSAGLNGVTATSSAGGSGGASGSGAAGGSWSTGTPGASAINGGGGGAGGGPVTVDFNGTDGGAPGGGGGASASTGGTISGFGARGQVRITWYMTSAITKKRRYIMIMGTS